MPTQGALERARPASGCGCVFGSLGCVVDSGESDGSFAICPRAEWGGCPGDVAEVPAGFVGGTTRYTVVACDVQGTQHYIGGVELLVHVHARAVSLGGKVGGVGVGGCDRGDVQDAYVHYGVWGDWADASRRDDVDGPCSITMRLSLSRLGFVLILLCFCAIPARSSKSQPSDEAYVTLLYGDEFLLGVRVLGKSIRDTGSTKDMADGWIVELISLLANPNQVRPARFWGVYTKLKIFNMTNYKKVVYLDADTIVVKSIEDLFKCGKFCANLKHSERLNSGVMVVEPSEAVFKDMMTKVTTLPSYTGDVGLYMLANKVLIKWTVSSE
ncbi:hypothetical protein RJ640_016255 [Escallonia rubra]|uniref:Hexosyltransferase n=1 Tax=Escallonia rubra TaxID=112253 RepID=A0AA88QTK0_9ASTE|nr:hypothetical protein RJ640_016255 [Escallonia rubra]